MNDIHFYDIEKSLRNEFPDLFRRLERLKKITGFISILGDDPRTKVFSRYHHIKRVVRLTNLLITVLPNRDPFKSLFLAFFHDINRLPFAHNLEKKIAFNQSKNLPEYLTSCSDKIPNDFVIDLQDVIGQKQQSSPEAQLVYVADAVEGYIEDPLFALSTLGISTEFLPKDVSQYLGFDTDNVHFQDNLRYLNHLYNNDPDKFIVTFGDITFDFASAFIERFNSGERFFLELPVFVTLKESLKEHFLRKVVFPLNNEKVSHGKCLAEEVAIPFMQYLENQKKDAIRTLQELTDQEVLDKAIQLDLISYAPSKYWPDLP